MLEHFKHKWHQSAFIGNCPKTVCSNYFTMAQWCLDVGHIALCHEKIFVFIMFWLCQCPLFQGITLKVYFLEDETNYKITKQNIEISFLISKGFFKLPEVPQILSEFFCFSYLSCLETKSMVDIWLSSYLGLGTLSWTQIWPYLTANFLFWLIVCEYTTWLSFSYCDLSFFFN